MTPLFHSTNVHYSLLSLISSNTLFMLCKFLLIPDPPAYKNYIEKEDIG